MRLAALVLLIACHHGAAPPPAASCVQAADHVALLLAAKPDLAPEVRTVFAARCAADHWSAEARACVLSTESLAHPRGCKALLPPAARTSLDIDLAAAAVRARDKNLPPGCRDYVRVMDKVLACDRIPESAREAMRQSYESFKQTWNEDSCRAVAEATQQSALAMGCAL